MYISGEIILKSYFSEELKEGMLFVNRISVGTINPFIEVFELKEIPNNVDDFLAKQGAPVELIVVDENQQIIALHDNIAWWDEGEHTDELRDITLKDINYIFKEFDGYVDVQLDDDEEEILMYENKIVLTFFTE
jgi:hypothetical protein